MLNQSEHLIRARSQKLSRDLCEEPELRSYRPVQSAAGSLAALEPVGEKVDEQGCLGGLGRPPKSLGDGSLSIPLALKAAGLSDASVWPGVPS